MQHRNRQTFISYILYKECLETGRFLSSWKKADVLLIDKKENRQLKKNYRPISLLPNCGKIFEKLMFDTIYEHLCANQLLTPNQSGFSTRRLNSQSTPLYYASNIFCL